MRVHSPPIGTEISSAACLTPRWHRGLFGTLGAWNDQRSTPVANDLAFDERFGLIVNAEQLSRDNRRLKRSLTQAKLKVTQACLEGVDYAANRKLDKAVVAQLATHAPTAPMRVCSRGLKHGSPD